MLRVMLDKEIKLVLLPEVIIPMMKNIESLVRMLPMPVFFYIGIIPI